MKKLFEINYWGTVRVVKAMLPLLKKSHGRIINISSMGGISFFSIITWQHVDHTGCPEKKYPF